MKIAVLALATLLGLSAAARADDYSGPPGNYDDVVVQPANRRVAPARGQRAEARREILQAFDTNGDGHLSPQERRHAAKVLRRMAKKLTREAKRERRAARRAARQGQAQGQGQGNVDIDIDVRP